jgi:hypothetical protein
MTSRISTASPRHPNRHFFEDIDVTAFRDDLGEAASVEELQALTCDRTSDRSLICPRFCHIAKL